MNNENTNSRRHYAPEEKVKILRQHLLEGKPISEVCEQHQINPTQFYQWQKTFFENGAAAFARQPHSRSVGKTEQTITALENKLKRKDEVIAEIMAEHIQLKKELGES
jgi:transposase-like protein